jgi:hypothetical protein
MSSFKSLQEWPNNKNLYENIGDLFLNETTRIQLSVRVFDSPTPE